MIQYVIISTFSLIIIIYRSILFSYVGAKGFHTIDSLLMLFPFLIRLKIPGRVLMCLTRSYIRN